MTNSNTYRLCFIYLAFCILSCAEDSGYTIVEPDPVSPVVFDIEQVPFQNLSDYNFFEGDLANLDPVYGVLPFTLNSTLFTDYAKKKRFVWMPNGSSASYVGDYDLLDFPTGSILIKNFYYDNVLPQLNTRILETRIMIRLEGEWIFANYIWNEDQTEATYSLDGNFVNLSWIENGQEKNVNYNIPAASRCFTCHSDFNGPLPIGVKPQNLNRSYNYADGTNNQLQKWIDQGYLVDELPDNINSTVQWDDASQPLGMRVRSYLDVNCAHCHSEQGYCNYAPIKLAFDKTESDLNLGVCVEHDFYLGEDISHIVTAGNAESSALYYRLLSTEEDTRMPLLGRTLVHEEGVALIQQWINLLNINCN